MKRRLALCLAWAVAGCVSPLDTAYKGADAGFLVASIGQAKPGYPLTREVNYLAVSDPPTGRNQAQIMFAPSSIFSTYDFDNDTFQGQVVIHHLKPGLYKLVGANASLGTSSWSDGRDISHFFDIKPGKTTYVGSFVGASTLSRDKDFFGQDIVLSVSLHAEDAHERDFAAARKHEPGLPPITQTSIPKLPRTQGGKRP
ncbi:MAG TPA: hypothetical protein VJS47_01535 [Rhizomicrobium sp.]|nr:hypothetical protein [Rhizomicrobium sp.]